MGHIWACGDTIVCTGTITIHMYGQVVPCSFTAYNIEHGVRKYPRQGRRSHDLKRVF